jgi:MFS family permease
MTNFLIVWSGQLVSFVGTGMTNFAVSFWIFRETGEAAALTWALFFFFAPTILASPLAGAIVDRTDRKTIMILSDLAAGLVTLAWLSLLAFDRLQLWHIYLGNIISGLFNSFQFPAYSAAVTLMLPKEQYGRANGLISLAGSASQITAPALAGALLGPMGLVGIMTIDVITFLAAIAALLLARIPRPTQAAEERAGAGTLLQESLYGFRYIFQRPSLLGLQLVFFSTNLLSTVGFVLLVPMILARTGNDEIALASVQSIGAVGGVVGGLLLATWGGPKRRVHGVLMGMVLASLLGEVLMGVGQVLVVWTTAAFMAQLLIPFINGSNQAIWQAKVAPDVQGRVFSVRLLIAQMTVPIATALAGPLADRVFEPAMRPGGPLSESLGWLVGTGRGAGLSLLILITGAAGLFVGLGGYLFPAIRNAEDILPDHDMASAPLAAPVS